MPEDPGPPPKEHMPLVKYGVSLAVAVFLDALKFVCNTLVLAGPFIAEEAAEIYAKTQHWPDWAAHLANYAVTGGGVALEITQPWLAGAVETIGIVLALVIGFLGWALFVVWFLLNGVSILKHGTRRVLALGLGWVASEVPLLDMLPTFTPTVWWICHDERKLYKRRLREWERKRSAYNQPSAAYG